MPAMAMGDDDSFSLTEWPDDAKYSLARIREWQVIRRLGYYHGNQLIQGDTCNRRVPIYINALWKVKCAARALNFKRIYGALVAFEGIYYNVLQDKTSASG